MLIDSMALAEQDGCICSDVQQLRRHTLDKKAANLHTYLRQMEFFEKINFEKIKVPT